MHALNNQTVCAGCSEGLDGITPRPDARQRVGSDGAEGGRVAILATIFSAYMGRHGTHDRQSRLYP